VLYPQNGDRILTKDYATPILCILIAKLRSYPHPADRNHNSHQKCLVLYFSTLQETSPEPNTTRSSAIAEGARDALISLHWLRVSERIIFKVATMYRALHGSAPPYLASSFTCVADMPHRRRLRSASTEQLGVPTCRRSIIGGRAFPVAGAKVWNGLPGEVTSASSLSVFKNRLLRHTCSAAVTKLFDFQLNSPFLVIISQPKTVVLAIVFTV